MQNLLGSLGLAPPVTFQLDLRGADGAPPPTVPPPSGGGGAAAPAPPAPQDTSTLAEAGGEALPLYANHATVAGEVKIAPQPGRRLEHAGIKVQLIGRIELAGETRGAKHDFLKLVRDLAPPGDLAAPVTFPFSFSNVELEHETYEGGAARLRYIVRVSITRAYAPTLAREWGLAVRNPLSAPPALSDLSASTLADGAAVPAAAAVPPPTPPGSAAHPASPPAPAPPQQPPPLRMEVGIEDCLHIEVEYDRASYPLDGVVHGKVSFLLVRIKLKCMELELRRRETVGGGAAARSDAATLGRFELMDGAPARGEAVPVRLHLGAYENLTPTYRDVHNRFSVRYYLNLVLVDEEDRRYFKQQEVLLYRAAGGAGGGGGGREGGSGWEAMLPPPAPPAGAGVGAPAPAGAAAAPPAPAPPPAPAAPAAPPAPAAPVGVVAEEPAPPPPPPPPAEPLASVPPAGPAVLPETVEEGASGDGGSGGVAGAAA